MHERQWFQANTAMKCPNTSPSRFEDSKTILLMVTGSATMHVQERMQAGKFLHSLFQGLESQESTGRSRETESKQISRWEERAPQSLGPGGLKA